MVAESKSEHTVGLIQEYKPSAYAETVWPTIEEAVSDTTFSVTQFEIISQLERTADPMFADFAASGKVSQRRDLREQEFQADQPDAHVRSTEAYEQISNDATHSEPEHGLESHGAHTAESFVQGVVEEIEPSEGGSEQAATDLRKQEFEAALSAARQEGYASGVAETRQEVDAVCAELRQGFNVLIDDFRAQSHELVQEHEQKAVELALQVARRMVGSVAETQREYVVAVIREAMQSVGGATIETIRISPQDFEFLVTQGAGEQLQVGAGATHVFTSDETVKSGCVIVTSSGEIDFDLDAAWSRLHAKVAEGPKA